MIKSTLLFIIGGTTLYLTLQNNRSGVGRQSVIPLRSTTASPPTLLIPLQSGKTADILRCRSGNP